MSEPGRAAARRHERNDGRSAARRGTESGLPAPKLNFLKGSPSAGGDSVLRAGAKRPVVRFVASLRASFGPLPRSSSDSGQTRPNARAECLTWSTRSPGGALRCRRSVPRGRRSAWACDSPPVVPRAALALVNRRGQFEELLVRQLPHRAIGQRLQLFELANRHAHVVFFHGSVARRWGQAAAPARGSPMRRATAPTLIFDSCRRRPWCR